MRKDIERSMIFIELVRGCNNVVCPSYGTLCSRENSPVEFMTKSTLSKIISDIQSNNEKLISLGRVDIWAYGCGDTLLHPHLDEMAEILRDLPFRKTVAIDSNCWRENTGWGNTLSPVILFKEGSFETQTLSEVCKKWTSNFPSPRFGFICKTLNANFIETIRAIQPWWNYPFVKIRSFHYVPLGEDFHPGKIKQFQRPDIVISNDLEVEDVPCQDKKAIRMMYRSDGTMRRCLVSSECKGSLETFLDGDLSDCELCWPYMAGEQILVYPDKLLRMNKSRCVSDKA